MIEILVTLALIGFGIYFYEMHLKNIVIFKAMFFIIRYFLRLFENAIFLYDLYSSYYFWSVQEILTYVNKWKYDTTIGEVNCEE